MEKENFGIDIDEVVVPFMKGYLKFHNKKHFTSFKLNDITSYHLWECGIHSSKEESIKEVLEFERSAFFDFPRLIYGAKRGIEELSKKYSLVFVTSRPFELKEKTREFFYRHFPNNGYEFLFSGEIHGGKSKSEICKEKNIRLMIEDNAQYALECALNEIKTFLLPKSWNKKYEKHPNLIKVKNWNEILKYLN